MHADAIRRLPGFDASGMSYPRISPTTLALVVAVHVAAIVALAHYRTEVPLPVERPIIISLVQPESASPVEPPKVIPPQPKPVKQKPTPQPQPRPEPRPEPVAETPRLVAQVPESTPVPAVSAPAPVAEPVHVAEPQPESPPAKQKPAPEEAPPIDPPRFNADYLDNPAPGYPPLSRKQGEQGTVQLRVRVSAAGTALEVSLHKTSGFPRLDQRAIDTVRQWKFVPARQGGQPVDAWVIVPITFSLKSKG